MMRELTLALVVTLAAVIAAELILRIWGYF
jgi:hypothetical protein